MKGKKYCKCGKYIAARCHECPYCKQNFQNGEKFTPPEKISPEKKAMIEYAIAFQKRNKHSIIHIPTQIPPYKWSLETNANWIENCIQHGREKGVLYTLTALHYFLVKQFGYCKKYKKAKKAVNDYVNTKCSNVSYRRNDLSEEQDSV